MTLPKRLVSLLLIYCFVIAMAPHPQAAVPLPTKFTRGAAQSTGDRSLISRLHDLLTSVLWGESSSVDEGEDKEEGLRFRLSEAPGQPEARPVSKIANATVLSDAETQTILNRLPQIKAQPGDEVEFALRAKSLPPPRAGATVMQSFPAPSEMARPEQT